MWHPRNLIVVGREARATVVETYAALGAAASLTNAVTEIILGDGARGEYYRVQRESPNAYHVATTHSHQGRDSHERVGRIKVATDEEPGDERAEATSTQSPLMQ